MSLEADQELARANTAVASLQIENEILKSRLSRKALRRGRGGPVRWIGGGGLLGFAAGALPALIETGRVGFPLVIGAAGAFVGVMAWLYGSIAVSAGNRDDLDFDGDVAPTNDGGGSPADGPAITGGN
jgi:hypothetical protein